MIFSWLAWSHQLKSKPLALLIFCLLLSCYFNYYTFEDIEILWNPFRYIDLGIHEIGHWVTKGFGLSVSVACGTLFQWMFPLVFAYSFLTRNDLFGFSFVGLWLSQNLLNSSHYCLSAIDSPDVIGKIGLNDLLHDWVYMFKHFLPLSWIHEIGFALWLLGLLAGLAFSFVCLIGILIHLGVISVAEISDSSAADFLERKN